MKILILLSNGFEETEIIAPADILVRGGVQVELCSITGIREMTGTHKFILLADSVLPSVVDEETAELIASKYDGVFLPGGQPNASNLQQDLRVIELVRAFHKQDKLVSAICAAPCVLEKAGLLTDKRATSYPGCVNSDNCREYTDEKVVRDGKVVTGKAAGAAIDFGLELLWALDMGEKAIEVKKQIFY